tara:strand:+ start:116 stop:652 length:537 start_codon:yes stop_codon:yes gene_type:complete
MKYINKIIKPIVTIISNIKYLLCNNIEEINLYQTKCIDNRASLHTMLLNRVNKIYDNIDIDNIEDKMYDMSNSIDDIQNDLEDKASQYQIQDIMHDEFGYSEDYVNYDDMNDIKEDIKDINIQIKDNIINQINDIERHLKTDIDNINLDLFYDKYHSEIVLKVIEEIIFKLSNNNDNV